MTVSAPHPDTTESRARAWLRHAGLPPATPLERLAGDASDRRFVRVDPPGAPSCVLVVHEGAIDPETLPLIRVAELFRKLPVPVPAIRSAHGDLGIVVVEDLGDTMLEDAAASAPAVERGTRYREAVEIIAAIQQGGRRLAASEAGPFGLAFDVAKLTQELSFFVEHFVVGLRARTLGTRTRRALDDECRALASDMAAEPRVLCHRDFHSRNLMLHRNRLCVIDFQDARMGPDTYDLVSLLRDAYVELEATEVELLLDHYQAIAGVRDGAALRRRFVRTTVQRSLKALGTFGYQITVRGNERYREAIPRTLSYARDAIGRDPQRRRLGVLLEAVLDDAGS
jgi:hypothetical protein